MERFWADHAHLGPLQRLMGALREVALTPAAAPELVLFIDEIDVVRRLPFEADEFFAALRECYDRRASDPLMTRLTFCLLGVALPSDLIRDPQSTPFNIGTRIALEDFTAAEALPLARGLAGSPEGKGARVAKRLPHALLKRVLYWTGGHPYLTQRLCRAVSEKRNSSPTAGSVHPSSGALWAAHPWDVDRLCRELFLDGLAPQRDDNLLFVREQLLHGYPDRAGLLELYGRVRAGRRVPDLESDPRSGSLRLAGGVRPAGGLLRLRNRIYARVFDRAWVTQHMPGAELRRQQAAYQRGLLRAAAIGGTMVVLAGALAATAVTSADRSRSQAKSLQVSLQRERQARQAEQDARLEADLSAFDAEAWAGREQTAREHWQAASGEANRQRKHAEASREESRRRLVRLVVASGARQADEGDAAGSLLWFSEGLRLDAGNAEREAAHRLRLASALRETPRLRQLWTMNGRLERIFFSPRGRFVLARTDDGMVRVWNRWTGRTVLGPLPAEGATGAAMFSPDDELLLLARNGVVQAWDVAAGRPAAPGIRYGPPLYAASFSPDGRRIVTIERAGGLRVWDRASGRRLWAGGPYYTFSFSPDGRLLAAATHRGTVEIRDAETGKEAASPFQQEELTFRIGFSPGGGGTHANAGAGSRIVTFGGHRTPRVWEVGSGKQSGTLSGNPEVDRVEFSADGRLLAALAPGEIQVWDVATCLPAGPPLHLPREAVAVSFTRGVVVRALNTEGGLWVWNVRSGRLLSPPRQLPGSASAACFAPDGRQVVTCTGGSLVRLWDTAAPGAPDVQIPSSGAAALRPAFSRDGRRVLVMETPAAARVLDTARGAPLGPALAQGPPLTAFAISPDGVRVATARGTSLQVRGAADGRPSFRPLSVRGVIQGLVFSRDGTLLLAGIATGAPLPNAPAVIQVLDMGTGVLGPDGISCAVTQSGAPHESILSPDGRSLLRLTGDSRTDIHRRQGRQFLSAWQLGAISASTFSPDGRLLATADRDGEVRLGSTRDGRPLRPTLRNGCEVCRLSFSPEGQRVASSGVDGVVRVWNVADGSLAAPPLSHTARVVDLAFSPDGHRLATLTVKGVAQVWDARTGEPLTVPLRNGAPGRVRFSPAGGRLLIALDTGGAAVWRLAPDPRPRADLLALAQLISGQRVQPNAAPAPLAPEVLAAS